MQGHQAHLLAGLSAANWLGSPIVLAAMVPVTGRCHAALHIHPSICSIPLLSLSVARIYQDRARLKSALDTSSMLEALTKLTQLT